MVPIIEPSSKKIVGIYNPCFDVTSTVIADRRLKLLREAGQSLNITSTPTKMFERICSEANAGVGAGTVGTMAACE